MLMAVIGDVHANLCALEAVLAAVDEEGIQTILRREGYPNPYEALLALTRTHAAIDQKAISDFINGLDVSAAVKAELSAITPENYTGIHDW